MSSFCAQSSPHMMPLLQTKSDNEEKFRELARRMEEVDARQQYVRIPIAARAAGAAVQDTADKESGEDTYNGIHSPDMNGGLEINDDDKWLELETVMKHFREYNKTRRGFRGLFCITIYFVVVVMMFWAANHEQSLNNSYTRLDKGLATLKPKGIDAIDSYKMWNSVKTKIIANSIFDPAKRVQKPQDCKQGEPKCPKDTYKFAKVAYLVGDVTITFSFGRLLNRLEDAEGFQSIRPFKQHMHEEPQDATRELDCQGKKQIPKNPGKNWFLKMFGSKYELGQGFRLYIPSTVDNVTEYLDCYSKFVSEDDVFDLSLSFAVYDPTTNPADWPVSATTVYGFVQASYTASPPWTANAKVVGESEVLTQLSVVPHDIYNFTKHPKSSVFRIVLEMAVLLCGICFFVYPQLVVHWGHRKMKPDRLSDQEKNLYKFLEATEKHCPEYINVVHDRSGKPHRTLVVVGLTLLLTAYVIMILLILTFKKQAADSLESVPDVDFQHFDKPSNQFEEGMLRYRFYRDGSKMVQICIMILFVLRIIDHAAFHPQVENLSKAFSALGSDFFTVALAYGVACVMIGASSSLYWGEENAADTGFLGATWLVFKSEFKLSNLDSNVPLFLHLGFQIAVDILLFKILTGMIVDSYKAMSNRRKGESESVFSGFGRWIKLEWKEIFAADDRGYVHPWQMAAAAHIHRIMMNLEIPEESSSDTDLQEADTHLFSRLKQIKEHDFIAGQANIIRALNRVYCLAHLGDKFVEVESKMSYEEAIREFLEEANEDGTGFIGIGFEGQEESLKAVKQELHEAFERAKKIKQESRAAVEIEQELIAVSFKLSAVKKRCQGNFLEGRIGGKTLKFCDKRHAEYAQTHYGITNSSAYNTLLRRLQEDEEARKETKDKADKAAIKEESLKRIKKEASALCKYEKYAEAQEDMIKEGKRLFHLFDVHCVGMMSIRFTDFWVYYLGPKGLSTNLTSEDYFEYMGTDPYFWQWSELEKLIKDPRNQIQHALVRSRTRRSLT